VAERINIYGGAVMVSARALFFRKFVAHASYGNCMGRMGWVGAAQPSLVSLVSSNITQQSRTADRDARSLRQQCDFNLIRQGYKPGHGRSVCCGFRPLLRYSTKAIVDHFQLEGACVREAVAKQEHHARGSSTVALEFLWLLRWLVILLLLGGLGRLQKTLLLSLPRQAQSFSIFLICIKSSVVSTALGAEAEGKEVSGGASVGRRRGQAHVPGSGTTGWKMWFLRSMRACCTCGQTTTRAKAIKMITHTTTFTNTPNN